MGVTAAIDTANGDKFSECSRHVGLDPVHQGRKRATMETSLRLQYVIGGRNGLDVKVLNEWIYWKRQQVGPQRRHCIFVRVLQ